MPVIRRMLTADPANLTQLAEAVVPELLRAPIPTHYYFPRKWLVNDDPYEKGWMIEIEMSSPADANELLSAKQYEELLASEH